MKLGKFLKIFLIIFDVVLLAFIINNFVRDYAPVERPMYWAGVIVEIGLGLLIYWFWMRSLLVKGFKLDKIVVVVLMVLGFILPNLYYISGIDLLQPAGSSDLFFFFSIVTLVIYSNYSVDKYLAEHRPRILKSKSG